MNDQGHSTIKDVGADRATVTLYCFFAFNAGVLVGVMLLAAVIGTH